MYDVELKFKGRPWKRIGATFDLQTEAYRHLLELKDSWRKSKKLSRPTRMRVVEID